MKKNINKKELLNQYREMPTFSGDVNHKQILIKTLENYGNSMITHNKVKKKLRFLLNSALLAIVLIVLSISIIYNDPNLDTNSANLPNDIYDGKQEFSILDITMSDDETIIDCILKGIPHQWVGFQMMTEKGMLVDSIGWSSDGLNRQEFEYSAIFSTVPDDGSSYLSIIPYYEENILISEYFFDSKVVDDNFPIVLNQGNVGSVIVHNITFDEEKTNLYYEVTGKDPQKQSTALWLIPDDGGELKATPKQLVDINRIDTYNYIMEYPPLDKDKGYLVGTIALPDLYLLENLEQRIHLKKD
ncbi:hypothetical protein [Bacillus alkalicellulosilyticus]|uniref:hypothetical protein n=1 Tax=Alkalihalobacterium alkalicellulosilyticum TaxID=1912214 RepID=UPI0009970E89|nr:hypothetical protein [Bacillus alkalicellulosilyticus]